MISAFSDILPVYSCSKSVSIKHGLRTADYGLRTGYKIRTRYKTRTGKYGLAIKHGQRIKRGLRTGYKIRIMKGKIRSKDC